MSNENEIVKLVTTMSEIKKQLAEARAYATSLQKDFDQIRKSLLPELMEDASIDAIAVESIGRISIRTDMYVSLNKDAKAEAMQWLTENGHECAVKPTVNATSLKAIIKEAYQQGQEIPSHLFNVEPYEMATLTATK